MPEFYATPCESCSTDDRSVIHVGDTPCPVLQEKCDHVVGTWTENEDGTLKVPLEDKKFRFCPDCGKRLL